MEIELFGSTIRETIETLRDKGADLGTTKEQKKKEKKKKNKRKVIARLVFSFLLVLVGTYLLVASDNESQITAGSSIITLVAGYWLK